MVKTINFFHKRPQVRKAWIMILDLARSIMTAAGERNFDEFKNIAPRLQWNLALFGQLLSLVSGPAAIKPHTINLCHIWISHIHDALELGITLFNFCDELVIEMYHQRLRVFATRNMGRYTSAGNDPVLIERALRNILQSSLLLQLDAAQTRPQFRLFNIQDEEEYNNHYAPHGWICEECNVLARLGDIVPFEFHDRLADNFRNDGKVLLYRTEFSKRRATSQRRHESATTSL